VIVLTQIYNPQHFDKLVKRVNECAAMTPNRAVHVLSKNACTWIDKKIEASSGKEKKFFEKCHNLVTSYVDGIKSGDVEVKSIKSLYKDLQQARTVHDAQIAAKLERAASKQTTAATSPFSDAEVPLSELLKEKEGFDHGAGAKETFAKYSVYKSELINSTTKPYVGIRMPILVLTSGIPDMFKLKRTGLCDDLLFGYPILKNQLLMGFNHDWLIENYPKDTGKKVELLTNGKKDVRIDYEGAISRVLGEIKKRTGRSYIQLGDIHGFHTQNLLWMWFASEGELRRLNGTTGGSLFHVKDWTLPFEREMVALKKRP